MTDKKNQGMQEVDAVKDPKMIERIYDALSDKGEVYGDIWKVGINVALRISDLLSLRFEDFEGDSLRVVEQKTGKTRRIPITDTVRHIVDRRRANHPGHVYVFQSDSNRAQGLVKPMNRSGVSRVFKEVGERASIGIHLGTHSMRKTRGYHLRYTHGVPIERVCRLLGHSSPAVTMRYIGLTQQDIDSLYTDYEL